MQDEIQKTIATDLGIADMPSDEQQKLITEFGLVALKAATVTILEKLPVEKRDQFAGLAEAKDPATLTAFLNRELPEHQAIAKQAVAEEIKRFKEYQQSLTG